MRSLRSVAAGGRDRAADVAELGLTTFAERFPVKLYWFLSRDYHPHEWQACFHAADTGPLLTRFRHLVAGRRGGKTLSAAWEVLFYCLHPEHFHADVHGTQSIRPLWVWVLTKDHKVGFPAEQAFRDVLLQAGLVKDKDYRWNKTEKLVEFPDGTIVQFKTADDPQSLRGAGLDILWMDEAAFISTKDAWLVTRPALSDKEGLVITTTTPDGKNWLWEEFFTGFALTDENQFRVEYTSIDNPYFKKAEWNYARETLHPIHFKQEYMASFDAMTGVALHGDWLHYFTMGMPGEGEVQLPRSDDGRITLRKFIGVDPATGEGEDQFAMVLIGVSPDNTMAFVLDVFSEHIPFPDQVDKIREWHLQYRPELIGVEANAYQRALVQQSQRLEGFPGIVPIISHGKKEQRILAMTPVFKIGKVRIHKDHHTFIDQWVSYDPTKSHQKDDILDATEIALGVAGVLLPNMTFEIPREDESLEADVQRQLSRMKRKQVHDPELGSEV